MANSSSAIWRSRVAAAIQFSLRCHAVRVQTLCALQVGAALCFVELAHFQGALGLGVLEWRRRGAHFDQRGPGFYVVTLFYIYARYGAGYFGFDGDLVARGNLADGERLFDQGIGAHGCGCGALFFLWCGHFKVGVGAAPEEKDGDEGEN
jgi:hypothetical protein